MMKRRTFVGAVGTLVAAGGLGLGGGILRRRQVRLAELAPGRIAFLAGRDVRLRGADGAEAAAVLEAADGKRVPGRHGAPTTEQVSLLLRPRDPGLAPGAYRIRTETEDLGVLHLTPVGPAGRERRLEAVITRIV